MKRNIPFLFSLILLFSLSVKASLPVGISNSIVAVDSLELRDVDGNIINNSTVEMLTNNIDIAVMEFHMVVKNNTTSNLSNIYFHKIENLLPETSSSMCSGEACYPPFVNTTPSALEIGPGQSDNNFKGAYEPKKKGGISTIIYEVYDSLSLPYPVYAKVTVKFIVSGLGFGENDNLYFKGPFPNPASHVAAFEYNVPKANTVQLIVRNVLGSEIERINLTGRSGKCVLDVVNYESGMYFYTFIIDGKAQQTKKLVVRH